MNTTILHRIYAFRTYIWHQATISTALLQHPKLIYSYDDYVYELRESSRDESGGERDYKTTQNSGQETIRVKKEVSSGMVLFYDEMIRRDRSKKLESK